MAAVLLPSRQRRARSSILASAALLTALLPAACADEPADAALETLRVGVVAPRGALGEAALRGVTLGSEEAERAGELVDRHLELRVTRAAGASATAEGVRELVAEDVTAVVGGFDEDACRTLARMAEEHGFLFVNVGCRADAFRTLGFQRSFHVEASESMYRDAGTASGSDRRGPPVLWHGELVRFGAAQLNDRFRERFGTPAEPAGWAGWMAVKILWETHLRTGDTDPDSLARHLEESDEGFDGHKGEPLAFDPTLRQLDQPLYRRDLRSSGSPGTDGAGEADPPTGAGAALAAAGTGSAAGVAEAWPSPDEVPDRLYVTHEGSHRLGVVDLAEGRTVTELPVGARPRGVRTAPGGGLVYVALSDDATRAETDRDAIVAVDAATGRVVSRHAAGTDPEQFDLAPDGSVLYSANEDAGTATVTDLETGEVVAVLRVGIEPEGVAVSPDGRWVYVTAETSNTVSVVDTRSHEVTTTFLVDVRPRDAAFSPDGSVAWVSAEIGSTLSVVDVSEHRVVDVIELEGGEAKPVGVVTSPDGARVYVATGEANTVAVIDAERREVIESVPVGRRPWGLAISPDGRRLYTANGGSDDVSVVDTEALEVVETIPVGERPWGVAVAP